MYELDQLIKERDRLHPNDKKRGVLNKHIYNLRNFGKINPIFVSNAIHKPKEKTDKDLFFKAIVILLALFFVAICFFY